MTHICVRSYSYNIAWCNIFRSGASPGPWGGPFPYGKGSGDLPWFGNFRLDTQVIFSKWGHGTSHDKERKRYISTSCCVSIDLRSESFPKCLRECYLWNAWKPRGVLFQTEKTQPSDLSSQSGHSAGTKSLSLVRLQQSEGPVHDKQTYGIKCRVDQTYKVFGQSRYFNRSVF